MSVLIKDMATPTNCLSCPLQGGTADCRLTQKTYNWGLTERPSDCPLVPIPPHGRLIDADAFKKYVSDGLETVKPYLHDEHLRLAEEITESLLIDVDEAPTVIPADGEDTNVPTREEKT